MLLDRHTNELKLPLSIIWKTVNTQGQEVLSSFSNLFGHKDAKCAFQSRVVSSEDNSESVRRDEFAIFFSRFKSAIFFSKLL